MTDTSSIEWLSKVARTHGEAGVLVVVLFKTIKSQLEIELRRQEQICGEEELNQYCLQRAQRLAAVGRSVASISEVRELLRKIVTETGSQPSGTR